MKSIEKHLEEISENLAYLIGIRGWEYTKVMELFRNQLNTLKEDIIGRLEHHQALANLHAHHEAYDYLKYIIEELENEGI